MAGNPELSRREALSGFAALSAAVAAMGTAATATIKDDTGTGDAVSFDTMAAMEFEPWERRDPPPPSAGEMGRLIKPHLTNLRIAWEMMLKTKPELIETARVMGADPDMPDLTEDVFKDLAGTAEMFREITELMDSAVARFACAISAGAIEQGAERTS